MVKYLNYAVTFEEVPDEITLSINITNCQNRCDGCHSPELRCDIGVELTKEELDRLIEKNDGITCVCLMGEGNDYTGIQALGDHLKHNHPELKRAIYYGRDKLDINYGAIFHYVKFGHYDKDCGPLNVETTNQRMYEFNHDRNINPDWNFRDITYKFWKRK